MSALIIILVSLTMTLFSEKVLISNRCIGGLMSNLIKKSWTDSIQNALCSKMSQFSNTVLPGSKSPHPHSQAPTQPHLPTQDVLRSKMFQFSNFIYNARILSFYVKHESMLSYFHSNWNVLTWGKLSQPDLSYFVFTLVTVPVFTSKLDYQIPNIAVIAVF